MNWSWIAGFYEGEGNPSYAACHGHVSAFLITIIQAEKSVLNEIRDFVGQGYVYPRRFRRAKKHRPTWMFRIAGVEAVKFAKKILPLMHSRRKTHQLERALKMYAV